MIHPLSLSSHLPPTIAQMQKLGSYMCDKYSIQLQDSKETDSKSIYFGYR